jgi:hypothetical protein
MAPQHGEESMKSNDAEGRFESHRALRTLAVGMLVGLAVIPLYALHGWKLGEFLSVTTVCIMLAGAALLVGGALGFLFGIPRSLQQEGPLERDEGNADSVRLTSQTATVGYRVNTNLEQISDWLTKILVGVGLTQINSIPGKLQEVIRYVAKGMGASASDEIFALSVLLYFVVVGFLFGYLWTRLFLAGALRRADLSAIGALATKIVKTDEKLEQFKKQSELDVKALNLAYQHLNPSRDLPEVTQEELNSAITSASRPIRVQIFNNAWQVRSETWQKEATKEKMERTIPIFRALIQNDPEEQYHRNHGQLGFALKDKRNPDWAEAEAELTKAIEIRGAWQDYGWLIYEFNRAVCRIMQDDAFGRGEPSDKATRAAILDDLRAASHANLFKLMARHPNIKQWMTLNKVSKADIVVKD